MGPKAERALRSRTSKTGSFTSQETAVPSQIAEPFPSDEDLDKMAASALFKSILEVNKDPRVERLLLALSGKISHDAFSAYLESEVRARSIVISGIEEASENSLPSERQADVELKVSKILDIIKVECRPEKILRMGRPSPSRPRLVKVVLPSKNCWKTALGNSKLLRSSAYPQVYIRRSMTSEERKKEFELREEARERNRGLHTKEWVVFRGELKRVTDLPRPWTSGNH
ncbi:hypothetical protein Y032_0596g436 [Ancylostoma ceylanicum]|uniref:Uncharacterized protein n=1 Tax=Ancylostoma ceylanicum TaxID=53326 RepID=A0A016WMB5_9BILA|nr:hypothetical protein Y032_0596g436 [Ancylostoma ceylanicum]